MPLIKDYNLDRDFDDLKTTVLKTGKIIKSSALKPSHDVVMPSQFSDEINFQPSDDPFDSEMAMEPEVPATPDPVVQSPQVAPIDEAKIREEIQQEFKPHFDDLAAAINGLQEARNQVVQSAETQLVDLALTIAEKVVHKKVEMDPSIIKDVVEDTFNKISGSDRITFKINPDDLAVFNEFQPYLESRLIGVEKISIQQDGTINQGGCIIETDLGFVDVTIKEKLNIIAQTFKKVKATL